MEGTEMTEAKMDRFDVMAEPLVDEILLLLKSIERRVPLGGSTTYKRAPMRSLRAALKRLKDANDFLEGIE